MDTHDRKTDTDVPAVESADAARPMTDMTGFQRNLLLVTAALAGERPHGLVIKEELESLAGDAVNHGRLYQNLGDLVDEGYVRKTPVDGRTNAYELTDKARRALLAHHRWQADCLRTESEHGCR